MSTNPQETPIEVLPPERGSLSPSERPATLTLREYLFSVPPLTPVAPPVFTRADCEGSFAHRFGVAVLASWQGFQFYLSPSGAFGAFLRIFIRWFIALIAVVILVGVPSSIAAQFLDSVAVLFESAARHFMWACIYIAAGCLIIAALIAGLMLATRK
jgi:hypothetical protein